MGLLLVSLIGCGTTTQQLATEQLLMSDAVDTAIAKIDFRHLEGRTVYLDTTYIRPVKAVGFVNADYIISSLRQQLSAANCLVQEDANAADIVIEPRVGALGTDGHEVTYGIPKTNAITSAAALLSSSPVASAVPEMSFGRNVAQSGIAKIIVFSYERETKLPVWQSGVAKAESNSSSTWFLGAGPFQKGTIYDGFRFAGKRLKNKAGHQAGLVPDQLPERVGYNAEHVFDLPKPIKLAESPAPAPEPETEAKLAAKPDSKPGGKPGGKPKPKRGSEVKQASHEEEKK